MERNDYATIDEPHLQNKRIRTVRGIVTVQRDGIYVPIVEEIKRLKRLVNVGQITPSAWKNRYGPTLVTLESIPVVRVRIGLSMMSVEVDVYGRRPAAAKHAPLLLSDLSDFLSRAQNKRGFRLGAWKIVGVRGIAPRKPT
jgi:hypothetical protein